MGRVITNGTSLSFAREASPGVLPGTPQWFELEPNGINAFGNTFSREARSPISRARARRKGVITDQDSTVEFEADLTLQHLRHVAEAFCFARAVGGDVFAPTAVTNLGYTIPALSGAAAGRISAQTLVYARGFSNPANNGLKPLTGDPAAAAVNLAVAGAVAEVPDATDLVEVAVAGVRGAVGDIEIDADGNLISTALDFTTLGWTDGQQIHVGGIDVLHQFATPANTGFARIRDIGAHLVVLDKKDLPFVEDDGAGVAVDILYGQFVRNVPVDHADYLEASTQFELASPNLMDAGATGYEYALSSYANALSIALPLSGKATITAGYICSNVTDPDTVRALGAANAKIGGQTAAFSTANDIARLRLTEVDEEGLTTDFKSATLTITNNVGPEKVLGQLGARYINVGNFEVAVESQVLFTEPRVVHAIRCNEDEALDFVLRNGDGGAAFDFPVGTLDGGGREYPVNESVLINTTFAAHQDDGLGFSIGISFFPVLPAQPC